MKRDLVESLFICNPEYIMRHGHGFSKGKDQTCFGQKGELSDIPNSRDTETENVSMWRKHKVYEAYPSRTSMFRSPRQPSQPSLHTCITDPGLPTTLLPVYLLFTVAPCLAHFWQILTVAEPKHRRRAADLKMLCLSIIVHFSSDSKNSALRIKCSIVE